jgi:methylated-DNA-[protein]-cysteine S-methyltransferase
MLQITVWIGKRGVTQSEVVPTSASALTCTIHNENAPAALEREVRAWLESYMAGKTLPLPPIDLGLQTPFTHRVLEWLQTIPFGEALTYGEVAKRLGNPRASRAVGGACGRNPILLLVPCHRVLALGNKLGGFTSGLEVKRRLLAHESIHLG